MNLITRSNSIHVCLLCYEYSIARNMQDDDIVINTALCELLIYFIIPIRKSKYVPYLKPKSITTTTE